MGSSRDLADLAVGNESLREWKPTRVAAIVHTNIVSGPGKQLAALATALPAQGVEVLVVAIQRRDGALSPYLRHLEAAGVPHVIAFERGRLDLGLLTGVGRLLDSWRPDVVQTHGYKPTAVAAALRVRRRSWKWIGFWHGATNEDRKVRLYHGLDRLLLRSADRVVVMSPEQRQSFVQRGIAAELIVNAVIPQPQPAADEAPLPEPAVRPLLGVVGRLSPEKGVDVFLHAAADLQARGVAFSAIIVGDGPERSALTTLCTELGVSERVRFVGTRSDIRRIYAAIDCLVLPSRSEGLPNVLLEALAADKPVVATSVGAVPMVVDSPLVGVVVPAESPSALADGIVRALPLAAGRQASLERRRVVDAFSLERRVAAHCALYASVLASGR